MSTETFLRKSQELAEELGQFRREGDSIYFPSQSDQTEPEHRVDLLMGSLYCTCLGFIYRRHCPHVERVKRMTNNEKGTNVVVHKPDAALPVTWQSPTDLARRLDELKQERAIVQAFFKEVMVESHKDANGRWLADGDYGIIPGTDKPTLFKAGAEKLCELYGFSIFIAEIREIPDYETGHYRVVCRVALQHKGSGAIAAEGVGECSTRESKYAYRWVYANDVPAGADKTKLPKREFTSRNGQTYVRYRLDNDDLFSVWNTVLKMAKKRALVDATLSATRSSGLFSQSVDRLEEWVDAEFREVGDEAPGESTPVAAERAARGKRSSQSAKPTAATAPKTDEPEPEFAPEPEPANPPGVQDVPMVTDAQRASIVEWHQWITENRGAPVLAAVGRVAKARFAYAVVDSRFATARLTEADATAYLQMLKEAETASSADEKAAQPELV